MSSLQELNHRRSAIRLFADTKPQLHNNSEMKNLQTRELHVAKRDVGRYNETRAEADSVRAQAEAGLRAARDATRDVSSLREESSLKTRESRGSSRRERRATSFDGKYEEVMAELESVKRELRMLKLEMAAVLEEKTRVDTRLAASLEKAELSSGQVEEIKDEIEEVNDELVVVELARIEALKERGEIEAERAKEAIRFSHAIDQTRRKMKDIAEEVERSKEFEPKLADTLADIDVLHRELTVVKEMEKTVRRNDESEAPVCLQSVTEELETAKKELASVKEEGFQYMASMDIIRKELKHVKSETARLEDVEKARESALQNLNAKLLRAKTKLEAVTSAEERANSIASNLSLTLEQLKTESEIAKKEKVLVLQETQSVKEELGETEAEIISADEKLEAAMLELEAAKTSEDFALENLKTRIENTVEARTSLLQHSSSITISKFEHAYLTGRAVGAAELADQKVAAATAWIEAIKANEREIQMKIEFAQREMREMRLEEDREEYRMERSFSAKRTVERELQNWRTKREKTERASGIAENVPHRTPKKASRSSATGGNGNGNTTPSRRTKFRGSASPGGRNFPVKKKTQVIPNLAKFFKGKAAASHV